MTKRSNNDVLDMRVALNTFRALDLDVAARSAVITSVIAVLVAADGLVSEYLSALSELHDREDDLHEAFIELDEWQYGHRHIDGEQLACAVRDEHDMSHEDPWIACRHAACRAASRLAVA